MYLGLFVAGDALKSHLDLLLLASVRGAPKHGYAIVEFLRESSGGRFDLPEGTVYPALHRLEQLGLLRSSWTDGPLRPRRVYALTRAGTKALGERRRNWDSFTAAMAGVLGNAD
jgi:DNA-binding PadR family transcriptional regulator